MLRRCFLSMLLVVCCLVFSGCQASAGTQDVLVPAQLSKEEESILHLVAGDDTVVYHLSSQETTRLAVNLYSLEAGEWKKQEGTLFGLQYDDATPISGRLLLALSGEIAKECRIAWQGDDGSVASACPEISFKEGAVYAASAFAQQEQTVVVGEPLPLLLLIGNEESSNTQAAIPVDFYHHPEQIGGDQAQMLALTLSE